MNYKKICLLSAVLLFIGCTSYYPTVQPTPPPVGFNPVATRPIPSEPLFDPFEIDKSALPEARDLPQPQNIKPTGPPRKYTGIIKNKTAYEVTVPSGNSGGTIIIPARGWTEYISYERRFLLTAYHDGKPFYCMSIKADPRTYAFMCDKYDFKVEIVKPEPKKVWPKKKKRVKKKPKPVEGA